MRSLKNNRAVSQVFSYMLALAITTVAVTASILVMTNTVDQKKDKIAYTVAEQIASYVADAILDLRTIREAYPNANYSKVLDIPINLVNPSYRYVIDVCDKGVYVNSTNGKISRMAGLLNTSQTQFITISGRVHSYAGGLEVYTNKTEYVYKFDFGPENSTMPLLQQKGYAKISHLCNISYPIPWNVWYPPNNQPIDDIFDAPIMDWKYRTAINVTNPTDQPMDDYQILVRLDPSNFDYSTANYNGFDLRFIGNDTDESTPVPLDYWIEVWKPHSTLTSRVWVELAHLPAEGTTIYMYHGYEGTPAVQSISSGTRTFDFFDNFTGGSLDSKWEKKPPAAGPGSLEIVNDMLYLSGNISIKTSTYQTPNPCIIETKARAIEYTKHDQKRQEASMFARYDTTADRVAYFSSGKNLEDIPHGNIYLYSDFAMLYKDGGSNVLFQPSGDLDVLQGASVDKSLTDEDWKRLTFILNESDYVIARYDYNTFIKEESTVWSDEELPPLRTGYFGLVTKNHLAEAYYDWIYVRKYLADVNAGDTYGEQFPTAYVGGTTSQYYHWDYTNIDPGKDELQSVTNNSLGGTLSRDYVNSSIKNGKFIIKNLVPDKFYTIALAMGDHNESNKIDNVQLRVTNGGVVETMEDDIDIDEGDYESFFFVTKPNANGKIEIQINDMGGDVFWWNICWMTVEKGIRAIYASEGDT